MLETEFVNRYTHVDVYELKKQYLDQFDHPNITKHHEDFLKATITEIYDNIIMNPPYIRTHDLSVEYRTFIRGHFTELNTGSIDIYYAFIIKCLRLLADTGRMVCITPNSYLYNTSAMALRQFVFGNGFVHEIIDFGYEKVFPNVSTYCCITVFSKQPKSSLLYNGVTIPYADILKPSYSLFEGPNVGVQNTLKHLCKITNGIATLRDKIYVHAARKFDEPCWKKITNGHSIKHIIYPYDGNGKLIKEATFHESNPLTYAFLTMHKSELAKRDKGKKKYAAWYAYGRTQSLRLPANNAIYIPCFLHPSHINKYLFTQEPILHQGSLCVEPKNSKDAQLIINSIKAHWDTVEKQCTKRSAGWINLSSRVLYKVIICTVGTVVDQ